MVISLAEWKAVMLIKKGNSSKTTFFMIFYFVAIRDVMNTDRMVNFKKDVSSFKIT